MIQCWQGYQETVLVTDNVSVKSFSSGKILEKVDDLLKNKSDYRMIHIRRNKLNGVNILNGIKK